MAEPSWAALKAQFVVVGGPYVHPTEAHFAAYEKSYGRPVPRHYRELMHHFGPGSFNDFVRVAAPHHLDTYAERMGLGAPDTTLLFASTDNGDELAWNLADDGAPMAILANRRHRANEFVPFAADCRAFVALVAERDLFFERGPRQPFFLPMRRRHAARLDFLAGAAATFQPRSRLLDQAGDEGTNPWSSWTIHLEEVDALAEVQATTRPDGAIGWGVRLAWPLDRERDAIRDALLREWARGEAGPVAEAFAAAKVHVVGIDLS